MSKLRRDVRLVMAGACSGLLSVSIFLLGARIVTYYQYLKFRETNEYATRNVSVEDLWWVPVAVWHVVLSIVATRLMHRYLPPGRASTFLRWQAIGIVVLAGWGLTLFTGVGLECLVRGDIWPIEHAWAMSKFVPVSQFVSAVFASNVLYGSAIEAASIESLRADTQQRDAISANETRYL
jgi:heme/copper-type cytochrome/quinol oxidase subunit 2